MMQTGELLKLMMKKSLPILNSNVLMLGCTFKENCPDIRNSKAIDVYNELKSYHLNIDVFDPWANSTEVENELGIKLVKEINIKYQAIILVVSHNEFLNLNLRTHLVKGGVLFDVKGVLDKGIIDLRL